MYTHLNLINTYNQMYHCIECISVCFFQNQYNNLVLNYDNIEIILWEQQKQSEMIHVAFSLTRNEYDSITVVNWADLV